MEELAAISCDLRRDRELACYGAEDLTPSSFHSRDDAGRAREVLNLAEPTVGPCRRRSTDCGSGQAEARTAVRIACEPKSRSADVVRALRRPRTP